MVPPSFLLLPQLGRVPVRPHDEDQVPPVRRGRVQRLPAQLGRGEPGGHQQVAHGRQQGGVAPAGLAVGPEPGSREREEGERGEGKIHTGWSETFVLIRGGPKLEAFAL